MNNLVHINNGFVKPFFIYIHDINRGIVSKSLQQYNVYEKDTTLIVVELLKQASSNNVFVDIGANIGYYSLMAAQYDVDKIYAFEPIKKNMNLLKNSIEQNNITNIEVIEKCVGSSDSNVYMIESRNLGGCSVTDQVTDNYCECIQFDNVSIDKEILICKIDVEGFEKNVIDGAINIIKNKQVKYFIIELTPRYLNHSNETVDLSNILISNGYNMYKISHNLNFTLKNGLVTDVESVLRKLKCRNFLFIRV